MHLNCNIDHASYLSNLYDVPIGFVTPAFLRQCIAWYAVADRKVAVARYRITCICRVPVNWETEKKKRKETEKKKNEKKTRRKVTKRNEKKQNAKKNENKIVRKETKQKKKKRKNPKETKRNEKYGSP